MNKTSHAELKLNCPTCKKTVLWSDLFPQRPFCSERCRLIDLGEWASESHKIPGDTLLIANDDDDE